MSKVAQVNIRSLNTSTNLLEDLCLKANLGVISLTEIWHPDIRTLKFLQSWSWHKTERQSRQGGGAATIIHPLIKNISRKDLFNPQLEATWCEIYEGNQSILVGSIYIPPDDEEAMKALIGKLQYISRT